MPIRAVGQNLIPLRGFRPSLRGDSFVSQTSLIDHHKQCHPDEMSLEPNVVQLLPHIFASGYEFFGRFVPVVTASNREIEGFVGHIGDIKQMPLSDVAAYHLEQVFGKADTEEEIFVTDGAMLENKSNGSVFWDAENDRIVVFTKEGFKLAIRGTNIVEAAVYLPRVYEEVLSGVRNIPLGIQFVEVVVEGDFKPFAEAASPLHVTINVPNLGNEHHSMLSLTVKARFKKAVAPFTANIDE